MYGAAYEEASAAVKGAVKCSEASAEGVAESYDGLAGCA